MCKRVKEKRLNVREINCLRGMVGVMRMDMISNDDMQIRTGMVNERKDREDSRALRLFGQKKRMNERRLMKRVTNAEACGPKHRARP